MSTKKNLSYYSKNKFEATFGLKVLTNLLSALNKCSKAQGRFVLLIETADDIVECYFERARDAVYSKRKLKKIARLAFRDGLEYRFTVERL